MRQVTLTPLWFSGYNGGWYKKKDTDWEYNEYCGYAANSGNLTYVLALSVPTGHIGKVTDVVFDEGLLFSCPYSTTNRSSLRWTITDSLDQTIISSMPQGTNLVTGIVNIPAYTTTWESHEATSWNTDTVVSEKFTLDTSVNSRTVYLYIHRKDSNTALRRCGYKQPKITIHYEPKSYTVNVNKGTGINSITGNCTVPYGDTVSLTAVTEGGHTFDKWTGYVSSKNNTVSFEMPKHDVSLTAEATPNKYSVKYNSNSYTVTNMPEAGEKVHGKSLKLSSKIPIVSDTEFSPFTVTLDCKKETYNRTTIIVTRSKQNNFSCWTLDGVAYDPGDTYDIDSDAEFLLTCTSTFVTSSIELPTPKRSGYEFLGWSTDENATMPDVELIYTPTSDVTLYPVWKSKGVVYIDKEDEWVPHTIWIDDGTRWKQYVAYYDTGTEWKLCGSTE